MIHGAGAGGWEWHVWRAVFESRGWTVDAPDLRPAQRLDDYAAQLDAPRGALLVGASLGGLLALMVAARLAPSALVLVNPLPPAPFHRGLPPRDWPDVVPWRANASLAGTRAALPDADDAACRYAFARWRDESGAVLREAYAGVDVALPTCRTLLMLSTNDEDVPPGAGISLAGALGERANIVRCDGASHAGPLLGRAAARFAVIAAAFSHPLDVEE